MAELATLIGGVGNTPIIGSKAHSAAVDANEMVVINGSVGVALNAALADVLNSYAFEGPCQFKKKAALATNVGDIVYFDNTNKEMTKTASGNTKAGVCIKDELAAATTVDFAMKMVGA